VEDEPEVMAKAQKLGKAIKKKLDEGR
jgi:hypothetical protein